jgi:hypothetical protein
MTEIHINGVQVRAMKFSIFNGINQALELTGGGPARQEALLQFRKNGVVHRELGESVREEGGPQF